MINDQASASFDIVVDEERSRVLSDAIADVMRGWDNPELLKAWKPAKAANFPPRYNVAPTDQIPNVRIDPRDGEREPTMALWGLIPFWKRSPRSRTSMRVPRPFISAPVPSGRQSNLLHERGERKVTSLTGSPEASLYAARHRP